jgi:hypothetical protein
MLERTEAELPQGAPSPPVLVAVITDPRDLQIARDEGWYRIPERHAPRRLAAEYLAFYQTRAFGDEKWSVRYMAPVRRYHLITRRELLPDQPDHPRADEQYYKLEIGPLEPLPHPIPSHRLRRITFIMTDLKSLLAAEEINDLWLSDRRQQLLWQELRQRQIEAERGYEVREGRATYQVDFAIPCREGMVAVQLEPAPVTDSPVEEAWSQMLAGQGWRLLRIPLESLESELAETLDLVGQEIARLGGPACRDPEN